jgi:hypothetical protein
MCTHQCGEKRNRLGKKITLENFSQPPTIPTTKENSPLIFASHLSSSLVANCL